jgi:1,5-anhydro-D-fructose reductase (1,5-anhydro-D-mannitol-forming)
VKIGIMSFAHVHAAGYAALLRDREDVELRVADPERPELQDEWPYASSYEELLAWQPDGVIVCAENARHRGFVEQAAAAGAHVLCEKPLATTVEDARAMVAACQQAGVSLMTAYPVRFHPAFRQLRSTIQAGALGRVLSAFGTNNGQAPISARPWFVDRELAGGGALMDHTVHLADLLDDLLGRTAVEVYAQVNRIVHAEEVSVETGGLLVVTYDDGTVATIDCSWSAPASFPAWGGLTLAIECEGGTVEFDAFADRLDLYDDAAGRLRWLDYGANLDALMLDTFLESVRSGVVAAPDGETGCRTLQIVAAAYRSAMSGEPELVESI